MTPEQAAAIEALEAIRDELTEWSIQVRQHAPQDRLELGRAVGIGDAAILINDEIRSRRKQAEVPA